MVGRKFVMEDPLKTPLRPPRGSLERLFPRHHAHRPGLGALQIDCHVVTCCHAIAGVSKIVGLNW